MPDKVSAITAQVGPGALLRNKRLEKGWPLADVARVLCLSNAQITALESDDYRNLPGRTYILGYWKTYANLLGIPVADLLAARKVRLPDEDAGPVSVSVSGVGAARQLHGNTERARHRFAFLFVLLSVIFLTSVWAWQKPADRFLLKWGEWGGVQTQTQDAHLAVTAPALLSPDARGGEQETLNPNPNPNPGQNPNQVANGDSYPVLPESMIALPEPNFSEHDTSSQPGLELNQGAQSASPVEANIVIPATTGATTGDITATALPQPQTPLSPNQITFTVRQKSWIEVSDDAGERLLYRTVAGGRRLTLEGKPPFSVFVGNAAGVTVHYRGKPVPLSAQANGLFARLDIGAP